MPGDLNYLLFELLTLLAYFLEAGGDNNYGLDAYFRSDLVLPHVTKFLAEVS